MRGIITERSLAADFIKKLNFLEKSYLLETDPIRQTGFGGGAKRWRNEREPILKAIETDAEILDVGCANGYLLECLIKWGGERGILLTPYGLDYSTRLIELARKRLHRYRDNFYIGNAWDWQPLKKFQYVYSLYDCVPQNFLEEYIYRLSSRVVSNNGRLIFGAYGSRSENKPPFDLKTFLESRNIPAAGFARGGVPPIASFVWIDKI